MTPARCSPADRMAAVSVRAATNNDSARIGELRSSLQATMLSLRGGSLLWQERHASPDMHRSMIFVAEVGGYVVGFLLCVMREADMEIFEVHVEETARGLGAGDALVAFAIEAARNEGARSVTADALPGDRDTKNLFERAGLISQRLLMRKDLA